MEQKTKSESKKGKPPSAGHRGNYAVIFSRGAARKERQRLALALKLVRLREKRPVGAHPPTDARRRAVRRTKFGAPR